MDKLQFLTFIFAVLLANSCNELLSNYRYISHFSILNIAPVCHIRLSKIKTLTLCQVLGTNIYNIHHCAKIHQKWSNICRDIGT